WAWRGPEVGLPTRIAAASQRGVAFLAATQRDSGEFPTEHWYTTEPGTPPKPVTTVFTASQILYSLAAGERSPDVKRMIGRTTRYLGAEREPPGVWRYYGKAAARMISPDIDDTAMGWAALARHGTAIERGALDAMRASRDRSGLFTTWVGDPSSWFGIDSRD